jgi:hypothetical protein
MHACMHAARANAVTSLHTPANPFQRSICKSYVQYCRKFSSYCTVLLDLAIWRQFPAFGTSDSDLDRQLRLGPSETSEPGVNSSTMSKPVLGYPLSLREMEAVANKRCGQASGDFLYRSCSPRGQRWDETTQTPWFSFLDNFGMAGQAFYDNVRRLALKYKFLRSVDGIGVGLFAVNWPLCDDRMWQTLGNFSG